MAKPVPASHPPADGSTRFTLDVSAETHAKFKLLCALNRTTMSAEINAIIAQQLADLHRLLSEALYVRVSAELKQELVQYAQERHISLGELLMEAMAWRQRQEEPPAPATNQRPEPVPSLPARRAIARVGRAVRMS